RTNVVVVVGCVLRTNVVVGTRFCVSAARTDVGNAALVYRMHATWRGNPQAAPAMPRWGAANHGVKHSATMCHTLTQMPISV
ncbi:MAG: hypothetical protein ACLFVO_24950, partial [Chloroflexaceae bacterium]